MKTILKTIAVVMAITGGVHAIEVIHTEEKPAGCEALGQIRAGDLFNRHSKDFAIHSVVDEAVKLQAQKVTVQLVAHQHPKLGRDYTATGTAWKCGK